VTEPGPPLPLIRLLAGERELARIAATDPKAPHVRWGLSALARARRPEWAEPINAFLSPEARGEREAIRTEDAP
jgi:hypothetical protein